MICCTRRGRFADWRERGGRRSHPRRLVVIVGSALGTFAVLAALKAAPGQADAPRPPTAAPAALSGEPASSARAYARPYSTVTAPLRTFFPLAIDYQPTSSFAAWKAEGINTVVRVPDGVSIEAWTAAARANGLRMIRDARPSPDDDDGETDLLAWMINDEPEAAPASLLENVRRRYQALRPFNSRPIFFNLAGQLVWGTTNDGCNGPGDGSNEHCYPDFIDSEDWVSNDIYPVNSFGGGDANLRLVGATLDKLRRWSHSKVQLAYVETSRQNLDPGTRPPTAAELRAEVWSAIIHGARGILYFPLGGCETGVCRESNATPPPVQAEMRAQNARITSLASVLQGTINPPSIGIGVPTPLEATWRISGTHRYFFVLNLSAAAITRTMTLRDATALAPITVVGERRSVGNRGNATFSDRFGGYELHIYRR